MMFYQDHHAVYPITSSLEMDINTSQLHQYEPPNWASSLKHIPQHFVKVRHILKYRNILKYTKLTVDREALLRRPGVTGYKLIHSWYFIIYIKITPPSKKCYLHHALHTTWGSSGGGDGCKRPGGTWIFARNVIRTCQGRQTSTWGPRWKMDDP